MATGAKNTVLVLWTKVPAMTKLPEIVVVGGAKNASPLLIKKVPVTATAALLKSASKVVVPWPFKVKLFAMLSGVLVAFLYIKPAVALPAYSVPLPESKTIAEMLVSGVSVETCQVPGAVQPV